MKIQGKEIVDISNSEAIQLEEFVKAVVFGGYIPNGILNFACRWIEENHL